MNRTELADRISIENGISRKEAKRWIDGVLKAVSESLGSEGKVLLRGFGTFEVRQHREKRVRNPNTGEMLLLLTRKVVVFRPSGPLKESLGQLHGPDVAENRQDGGEAAYTERNPGKSDPPHSHQREPN